MLTFRSFVIEKKRNIVDKFETFYVDITHNAPTSSLTDLRVINITTKCDSGIQNPDLSSCKLLQAAPVVEMEQKVESLCVVSTVALTHGRCTVSPDGHMIFTGQKSMQQVEHDLKQLRALLS